MDAIVVFVTISLAVLGVICNVEAESCPYFGPTGRVVLMTCPHGCCGSEHVRYCCGGPHLGLILGITLGGLTLVGLIVGVVVCCYCGICACFSLNKISTSSSSSAGCLVQSGWSYSCTYIDRFGVLKYVSCPYSECCGHLHYRYCCSYYNVGGIVGGVLGTMILIGLIAGCISCFFCACCPIYQRRQNGYIVQRNVPNYSSTTVHTIPGASNPYQSTQVTRTPAGVYTSPPPQYKP